MANSSVLNSTLNNFTTLKNTLNRLQTDKISGKNSAANNLNYLAGTAAARQSSLLASAQESNESLLLLANSRLSSTETLQNIVKQIEDIAFKASGSISDDVRHSLQTSLIEFTRQFNDVINEKSGQTSILGKGKESNNSVSNILTASQKAITIAANKVLIASQLITGAGASTLAERKTAMAGSHTMWAVTEAAAIATAFAKKQGATDSQILELATNVANRVATRATTATLTGANLAAVEASLDTDLSAANIVTDMTNALGDVGFTLTSPQSTLITNTLTALIATTPATTYATNGNLFASKAANVATLLTDPSINDVAATITSRIAAAGLAGGQATAAASDTVKRAATMVAAYTSRFALSQGVSAVNSQAAANAAVGALLDNVIATVSAAAGGSELTSIQDGIANGHWVQNAVNNSLSMAANPQIASNASAAVAAQLAVPTGTSVAAYGTSATNTQAAILLAANSDAGSSETYILDTSGDSQINVKYMNLTANMLTSQMTDISTSTTATQAYNLLQNLVDMISTKDGENKAIKSATEQRITNLKSSIQTQDEIFDATLAISEEEVKQQIDEVFNQFLKCYQTLAEKSKLDQQRERHLYS